MVIICSRCKDEKPCSEFNENKTRHTGYSDKCRPCNRDYQIEYRKRKSEELNKKKREKYSTDEGRSKMLESSKKSYQKHRDRRLKECAKYRENNREAARKYAEDYRKKNPNSRKEYAKNNKDKINAWNRHKYATDDNFRITRVLRSRMSQALFGKSKSGTTEELLGCTVEEAMLYLENQFSEGMSWENHGEWHIDHRKPCAAFDLTNEEEQKECFNYKNLQPLWATENLQKSSKYEEN